MGQKKKGEKEEKRKEKKKGGDQKRTKNFIKDLEQAWNVRDLSGDKPFALVVAARRASGRTCVWRVENIQKGELFS